MKIFAVIPVHNRLSHTQGILEALRKQTIRENITIIVVDDGSTDGTADYLQAQVDVVTLKGDGGLWWAGAVELGVQQALASAADDDFIQLLNDDTTFDEAYVGGLADVYRSNPGSLVGSVLHEVGSTPPLVSIGPRINLNRVAIWDRLSELSAEEMCTLAPTYEVDALAGRGMLVPVYAMRKFGTLRPRLLPHYLADYEFSFRMKKNGMKLLVSSSAQVWSPPVYGNGSNRFSGISKYFKRGSPKNLLNILTFYMLAGTPLQRMTAPMRVIFFYAHSAYLRHKHSR
jgi:GT2 family glycosyltransferase